MEAAGLPEDELGEFLRRSDLGGRGRRHGPEERQVILELVTEAEHMGDGANLGP